jgi:hypothetical protein
MPFTDYLTTQMGGFTDLIALGFFTLMAFILYKFATSKQEKL